MGAVSFSLDKRIARLLVYQLELNTFVETGTFKGDTVAAMESLFAKLISIELSEKLFEEACNRFADVESVTVLQGKSEEVLSSLNTSLANERVLYWLDAHWCADSNTAGVHSQCPLIDELKAIKTLNSNSVILIDDARLFLAAPHAPQDISQWPSFHEVLNTLLDLSGEHAIVILNDVILFYPLRIKQAIDDYAQNHGIDWLQAARSFQEYELIREIAEQRKQLIVELNNSVKDKDVKIDDLSRRLKESILAVKAYRLAYWPLFPIAVSIRFILRLPIVVLQTLLPQLGKLELPDAASLFNPRIGNLEQYAPKPLRQQSQSTTYDSLANYPRISIVTPSFAQGDYIERTIRSVLDQEYPNLEYIVQDGGSEDNTVEVLKMYEERLKWFSEPDEGQSQAINRGFEHTTGEVMAWLNSDDLLLPNSLAKIAEYFSSHPEIDVVYGNRVMINEEDLDIGRWILPGHDGNVLSWADFVPQETMFWRRTLWERVGSELDESFRFALDWDLLLRFRDSGANFGFIPVVLGGFRIHSLQKTSASIEEIGNEEMDKIRKRVLGHVPNRAEIAKAIFPFLMRHWIADAAYGIRTYLKGTSKNTSFPAQ